MLMRHVGLLLSHDPLQSAGRSGLATPKADPPTGREGIGLLAEEAEVSEHGVDGVDSVPWPGVAVFCPLGERGKQR